MKKKLEKPTFWFMFLAILTIAAILAMGNYYISNVQNSIWKQSVSEIIEITKQDAHTFDTYIAKDLVMVKHIGWHLTHYNSNDTAEIKNIISNSDEADYYVCINLNDGLLYNDFSDNGTALSEKELENYKSFENYGVCKPFYDNNSESLLFGCYERFKFSDGVDAIVQKLQPVSIMSDAFSLSFYDDSGFSYIINDDGDVLIGSNNENSDKSFQNIFDIIDLDNKNNKNLSSLHNELKNGFRDSVRFSYNDMDYVFAFSPVENIEGWYIVSMVPDNAIMKHTKEVMKISQAFLLVIISSISILAIYFLFMNQVRKNAREKEQIFSILANNTDNVFLMLSANDFKVEYVSPNVERVLGINYDNAKKSIEAFKMYNPENDTCYHYNMLSKLKEGESKFIEGERVNLKTGERRWVKEFLYFVSTENADKYIVIISDRTLEKQNKDKLTEALQAARSANESKSVFLSNMSHDIRTPMNAIVGLCTLLHRDAANEERVHEYVKKITASSQHLLGLINDVLDMSKIESGKTTLNVSEINLAEIVDELETIMLPQAKSRKQQFDIYVFDITQEHLLADKLRLNQILINLLSNAVKYTPVGGKIEMTIRQLPQNNKSFARFLFIIHDNGIGMSEEYLETIFEPFTRETSDATIKIQGTGLGMAITKNLVELMGGTIKVESKLGEGSTFTVEMEMRISEQEIDQEFWNKHNITNMLVVDDEIEVCTNIIAAMAETGVSMQFAMDGFSAIKMVESSSKSNHKFDFILLDLKMPELDGIETARRIREIMPNIPIMISTSYDWSLVEEEAIKAGITGFLPKPFFISNFCQILETLESNKDKDDIPKSEEILKGLHFLLAEDIDLNMEILVEILSMSGVICDSASNGQEAVDKFAASKPNEYDAILMDVQMPILDGYEATKAIRALDRPDAKKIPIVAMTANAFAEDVQEAKKSGMNEHISKPLDIERLVEVMNRLL